MLGEFKTKSLCMFLLCFVLGYGGGGGGSSDTGGEEPIPIGGDAATPTNYSGRYNLVVASGTMYCANGQSAPLQGSSALFSVSQIGNSLRLTGYGLTPAGYTITADTGHVGTVNSNGAFSTTRNISGRSSTGITFSVTFRLIGQFVTGGWLGTLNASVTANRLSCNASRSFSGSKVSAINDRPTLLPNEKYDSQDQENGEFENLQLIRLMNLW